MGEADEKDHAENHAAALLQTSAASSPESNWGPMDLIRAKKAWDKMSAEEKDEQMKYWIRAKKAWDKMSAEEQDERMQHLTEQWKKKKQEQNEEQKEAENYAEDHVEEAAEKDHAENHAAALLQTSAASSPES